MEYLFQKCSWQQFLKTQVSVSTAASLKPKKAQWDFQLPKLEKTNMLLKMHQEHNAPFMMKNINSAFFCVQFWHKKKTDLTLS